MNPTHRMTFEVTVDFDFDSVQSDGSPGWGHQDTAFLTTLDATVFKNVNSISESIQAVLVEQYGALQHDVAWNIALRRVESLGTEPVEIDPAEFQELVATWQGIAQRDLINLLQGKNSYDNMEQILEDFAFQVKGVAERMINAAER